jgi:hypothetical protein
MPGNVSVGDGTLHSPAILGRSLLKVLVEEPGTSGPNVAAWAGPAHLFGYANGLGEELGEVASNDRSLGINKAGIKMALEHSQDTLDLRIRRGRRGHRCLQGKSSALAGTEHASQGDD